MYTPPEKTDFNFFQPLRRLELCETERTITGSARPAAHCRGEDSLRPASAPLNFQTARLRNLGLL
jgi:hypothetical protein